MTIEKRRYERFFIPGEVLIKNHNLIIQCWIENISYYGAYLKAGFTDSSLKLEVGENVGLTISSPNIATQELSGKILRRSIEDENMYYAVYFIQPYTFN